MEKERQGPRPQGGRAAARGNTRPSAPSARPRANAARPYQSAPRHSAVTPPPPYIPPAYPGRYPAPGRVRKPSPTTAKPQGRGQSLTVRAAQARKQPLTNAKPSAAKTQEELAEERFRDALWPKTRETPFQRRAAFLLSLLYALIYIACSLLLIHPLNVLTARMPFPVSDMVRAALPACAGTLLCALTRLRFPDEPRMMLLAYRRLLREVLLIFVALQVLIWGEWDAQRMIARFTLQFVSGPLVVGTAAAVLLFYLDWLYIEVDEEEDA